VHLEANRALRTHHPQIHHLRKQPTPCQEEIRRRCKHDDLVTVLSPSSAAVTARKDDALAARPNASRADRFPMVLPSPGSTSSSRSPRSSSSFSGVMKVAESVTGTGRFRPFSPVGQGFARYAGGPYRWGACPSLNRCHSYPAGT